jgi:hypothetical protein
MSGQLSYTGDPTIPAGMGTGAHVERSEVFVPFTVDPLPDALCDAHWHTVACDSDATSIKLTLDGSTIWTYMGTHLPQIAMYLPFAMAVIGANQNGWPVAVAADYDFGAELRVNDSS